jgi:aldose 1-epimerase
VSITTRSFGKTKEGIDVTEFTVANRNGHEFKIINYGCTITSLSIPDRNGNVDNIVLGFDSLDGYMQSGHYLGSVIGRCANRIAEGQFTLEHKSYHLTKNHGDHHLHGGYRGFDKIVWSASVVENEQGAGVEFYYLSKEGEEGYPGNLNVNVRYFLANDNALIITFAAKSDASTIINLTEHSYYNLNGVSGNVLSHELMINASYFLPVDHRLIPTGEIQYVENNAFDFREFKKIGSNLFDDDQQLNFAQGYDHNYVLLKIGEELSHAATLRSPDNGRAIEIHTTEPGLQLYTANSLEGKGRNNIQYGRYSGVCLETQHFPDAPNHPDFPSIALAAGELYTSIKVIKFFAR